MEGKVLVVLDVEGFVGAFPSEQAALEALTPYPTSSDLLIAAWYPYSADPMAPGASVYAVPLRGGSGALAYVAEDRETAVRLHEVYSRVGQVYGDKVDYCERAVGAVSERAAARLVEREKQASLARAGPSAIEAQTRRDEKMVSDFLAWAERGEGTPEAGAASVGPPLPGLPIAPPPPVYEPAFSILGEVVRTQDPPDVPEERDETEAG